MIDRARNAVRTLLGMPLLRAHPTLPLSEQLRQQLDTLTARVDALSRAEAVRNAEHAAMVDQLDRLYKRIAARIARSSDSTNGPDESTLTLRQRLRR